MTRDNDDPPPEAYAPPGMGPPKPKVDSYGVPWCTQENCPHHDGKRCELLGFRPGGVCEPAVRSMESELAAWRKGDPGAINAARARVDAWRKK